MSKKSYRGHAGKTVWENRRFNNGMNYSDEPTNEGTVRNICNMDINRSRGLATVRDPFYSAAFKYESDAEPRGLNKDTIMFKSIQDANQEFFITIGDERQDLGYKELNFQNVYKGSPSSNHVEPFVRVIDGDTIAYKEFRFRLLAIDAPEMDEGGEIAQTLLYDKLNSADNIIVVYDKRSDSAIDKYERHLVWVYYTKPNDTTYYNANLELLQASTGNVQLMGAFDEDLDVLDFPNYQGTEPFHFDFENVVNTTQTSKMISNNKTVNIHQSIPQTINVFNKDIHTNLNGYHEEGYVKIPVIELETVIGQVDTSQLYTDLDIPYGVPMRMSLNTVVHNQENNYAEYKPWTRLDDIDGIVFLGTIYANDQEVYKGIISIKYFVPLKDNTPLYDQATFKVETYKDNAFSVKFEELNTRYSLNLLDPKIPGREDFIGEEAEDNNYYTYLIPTLGILNERGNFVSQLAQGRNYTIRPYYVLPEIEDIEGFDGYALKWDLHSSNTYYRDRIIRYYASTEGLPPRGSLNVVYIISSENNQHYRWDGENYITDTPPTPIQTTGWKPVFDKEGKTLSDYYAYTVLEGSPNTIRNSFIEKRVFTTTQKRDPIRFHIEMSHVIDQNDPNSMVRKAGLVPLPSGSYKFKIYIASGQDPINTGPNAEGLKPTVTIETQGGILLTSNFDTYDPATKTMFVELDLPNTDEWFMRLDNLMGDGLRAYVRPAYSGFEMEGPTTNTPAYLEGAVKMEDADYVLDTGSNFFQTALDVSRGDVYGQVYLAPYSLDGEGGIVQTDLELETASRLNTFVARVRNTEEEEPQYQHGQDLHNCTGITTYKGQLLLYGNPKTPTVIYMSDEGGNISYFPFRRALDQFHSDILHIETVKQGIIVFTTSDIYMVTEVVDELDQIHYMATIVQSNVSIKPYNRNTIRATGRDILFMSEDRLLMLRPNPYVDDASDMFLEDISSGIKELIEDPVSYVQERLRYYGENVDLSDYDCKVESYSVVKNESTWLHISVDIPGLDPFMIIAIYVRSQRPFFWQLYETRAMAFPYDHVIHNPLEGHHVLMRNHRTLNGGVTMMMNEALNLWDFAEDFGNLFDIKPLKLDEAGTEFIYNLVPMSTLETYQEDEAYQKIKQPIRATIDTGFMNIDPHLMKRFHKFYVEIHNIDALNLPLYMHFTVDGVPRQTSEHTQLVPDEQGVLKHKYEFHSALLGLWELDLSLFSEINRFRIDLGLSGRGRLPRMVLVFKATGKFKLHGYGIIFKEQSAR